MILFDVIICGQRMLSVMYSLTIAYSYVGNGVSVMIIAWPPQNGAT